MCDFKVGDYIYKRQNNKIDSQLKLYKILDIKERQDGFSISYIAKILSQDLATDYSSTEEYLIQFIKDICQINYIYGIIVDDTYIRTY